MTATGGRWSNVDAGPVQVKHVRAALAALVKEGQTIVRLVGVRGVDESRIVVTETGGEIRPDVVQVYEELGERFGWVMTARNQRDIIRAAETATDEAGRRRPEVDERVEPCAVIDRKRRFAELRALLAEAS